MDGRAASLLPPLRFTIMKSRVRGIADHILPLSDWFGLKSSFEVRRQAWGLKGRFEVLKADLKPGGLESRYEVWKADLMTRSHLLPCKKRLTRCWSIPIIWSAHPGNYNIQTDTYPWNYITFTQKTKESDKAPSRVKKMQLTTYSSIPSSRHYALNLLQKKNHLESLCSVQLTLPL